MLHARRLRRGADVTGASHYLEAERILAQKSASDHETTRALAHALLANAAATALPHLGDMWIADRREWEAACSAHEHGEPE